MLVHETQTCQGLRQILEMVILMNLRVRVTPHAFRIHTPGHEDEAIREQIVKRMLTASNANSSKYLLNFAQPEHRN